MTTATISGRRRAQGRRVARLRRHARVRKNVTGTSACPRLCVFRSARHIYAQVVDDTTGRVLAAASTVDSTIRGGDGDKRAQAKRVGALVAERAKAAGVGRVSFDRGGYKYQGRIAALADAAREGGLQF